MHKTVSVSIGASLFVIEESAYAKLDAYLKAIRAHFASSPDAEEILSDIEDRIGEELSDTLSVRKKVILMKDVEDVIRTMGTIEDFEQFDGEAPTGKKSGDDALPPWKKLKLYRDADDQIIGGVCAGIAKYLGIDPLIIRLAFGLSLLLGGFGVVLYILLWILLPEARTTAEKVEMTGGRVTLSAIQNRIDETLPPEKRKNIFNTLFTLPFAIVGTVLRALGRILRVLFPLAGRLLGLLILVACSFAIAMMTFVLLALLFNPTSPYIGFPLAASLSAWSYVTLLLSAYAAVILPLIFVILFGASLVSLRNVFTMPAVTALGSVWFFMLVVGGVTAFTVGPQIETAVERYEAEHHDAMVTTPFDLRDFTVIEVGGITRLEVTKGDAFKAELESAKDDVALINLAVKDGILTLERSHRNDRCIFFCGDRGHTLRVTMPSLQKLETSGVAYATVNGFSEEEAMFSASGNSYIEAALDAQTMNVNLSGVSHISLKGTGTKLMSVLSGNSTLSASAFAVKTAMVNLSGVSQAMIDASEEITGEASGNSSLYYKTAPVKLEVQTSGVSAVRQREEDDGYEQW